MYKCPECPREFVSGEDLWYHHYEEHIKPDWEAAKAKLNQPTEHREVSSKLTIPALGELQCLCRTQYHCEKHCTAGDHV